MGLSQSYLSQSAFGYDTVSSVDVNGLNGILKKYYTNSAAKFTATTLYFIKDNNGNPEIIELAYLLALTGNIDPLTVKSTDTASVNAIKNTPFYFAFKFTPGNPSTVASFKYNYLSFVLGTQNVVYTLCCQDIQLAFFDTGSTTWVNAKQSDGSTLYSINATITLLNILKNENLSEAVQNELNDLGNEGLSVYQLLFDFTTAVIDPSTTIPALTKDSAIFTPFLEEFIPTYVQEFYKVVYPVLNYSIVQPNSATLLPTSLDFCFEQVVDANGNVISSPTPAEFSQCTLNYLFATNGRTLPAPKQFNWNWLDAGDVANYNGAMATNRNTFATYFHNSLLKYVNSNCYNPSIEVGSYPYPPEYLINIDFVTAEGGVVPLNPDTIGLAPDILLQYSFSGNASAAGWGSNDSDNMKVNTYFALTLSVDTPSGSSQLSKDLILVQTIWVYINATGNSNIEGYVPYRRNAISKTYTDTFSVIVDPQGNVNLTNTYSHLDDFSDTNPPVYIADAMQMFKNYDTAANFVEVPISMPKQFVFPGGDTFTFANAGFSPYSDLVCNVTYNSVSS